MKFTIDQILIAGVCLILWLVIVYGLHLWTLA